MGAAFRRCWVPALSSAQLANPDADPVHVELLGEHFVAFRALGSRADVAHIAGVHGELDCGDNWRSLVPAHRSAVRDPSRLQTVVPGSEA
jgi:hypothetical protein